MIDIDSKLSRTDRDVLFCWHRIEQKNPRGLVLLHRSREGGVRWWKLRTDAPIRRMPNKYNTERRHRIAKMKFNAANWG